MKKLFYFLLDFAVWLFFVGGLFLLVAIGMRWVSLVELRDIFGFVPL